MKACSYNNLNAVKLLIDYNADKELKNNVNIIFSIKLNIVMLIFTNNKYRIKKLV